MKCFPHVHAAYVNAAGRPRELVVRPAAHGSLLVLDRDPLRPRESPRLVAHIPADEPVGNALLVGHMYMSERGARPCRPLMREDLVRAPLACEPGTSGARGLCAAEDLVRDGRVYAIRSHQRARRPAGCGELRWSRCGVAGGPWTALTLREVLAAFESYEPMLSLTRRAIARDASHPESVDTLRRELERVQRSSYVLNRGLREAVLDAVARHGASMSQIALRCGMAKGGRRGPGGGDTTWLARRIGLAPESGGRVTRWVHSDVLGLIARRGLGIGPHEVEL